MVDRVSTYQLSQTTLRDASSVQAKLAQLQNQLSSGVKSDNFEGIGTQTSQLISLETKLSRGTTYQQDNQIIAARIDSTNSSLDQVISTATSLKSLISQQQNPATGQPPAAFLQQLTDAWQSLTQSLNTNLSGRYLFSGDRTDTPAVNTANFPTLQQSGQPDTGYYQGGTQDTSAQVDDGINMTYGVRADDPAFQKVFAGLAMAKKASDDNSTTEMQQAYTFMQDGLNGVIAVQSTVNTNKVSLSQVGTRQQGLQLYWQGLKENIVNTDLVSASTQVAVDQGILQASFQTFAKINSLSLADFLK